MKFSGWVGDQHIFSYLEDAPHTPSRENPALIPLIISFTFTAVETSAKLPFFWITLDKIWFIRSVTSLAPVLLVTIIISDINFIVERIYVNSFSNLRQIAA